MYKQRDLKAEEVIWVIIFLSIKEKNHYIQPANTFGNFVNLII